jgi:hypothetical protein
MYSSWSVPLMAPVLSALSQPTRWVAQRLVTATVTPTLAYPRGHVPAMNGPHEPITPFSPTAG